MYKQNKTEIKSASSVRRDTQDFVLAPNEEQEDPTATVTNEANKSTVTDLSDASKHELKQNATPMQKGEEGFNKISDDILSNQARPEPENIQRTKKPYRKTHPKTDVKEDKKKRDSHKTRRQIVKEDLAKQKDTSAEGSSMANTEIPKSTSNDTVPLMMTPSVAPDIFVPLNQLNQVKYDMFQQAMSQSTDVTMKKPPINADDLLIKKRMLKKVDRHSEYNPGL